MMSPLSFCGGNPIMYVDPTVNDSIYVWEQLSCDGEDIVGRLVAIGYTTDDKRYLVQGETAENIRSKTEKESPIESLEVSEEVAVLPTKKELKIIQSNLENSNLKGVEFGGHFEGNDYYEWKLGGEINRFRPDDVSIKPFRLKSNKHSYKYRDVTSYYHTHPRVKGYSGTGLADPFFNDMNYDQIRRTANGYKGTTILVGGENNIIRFYYGFSLFPKIPIKYLDNLLNTSK